MNNEGKFSVAHGTHARISSYLYPITVIAVCYNHERFVIECLESIRNQTLRNFELIIVDDKSSDNSVALISEWRRNKFPEAQFLPHSENIGLCKTLNEALSLSSGKYIGLIATDDTWLPNKLESQLARFECLPEEYAVVYADAEQMDEEGITLPKSFIEAHRDPSLKFGKDTFCELADGNFIPAMATLIRRSALEAVGGYDERLTYEDYDIWLRLSDQFKFDYDPQKVARYRIVGTSMVRTLFAKPTARHSYSVFSVHRKWINSRKLSKSQRKRWGNKIADAAYSLYVVGDPRAASALRYGAFYTRSFRLAVLALLSSIGISRNVAKRIIGSA